MGPRDECMKVNFNTFDTDKDMCLKKGCCFFAPKRSTAFFDAPDCMWLRLVAPDCS